MSWSTLLFGFGLFSAAKKKKSAPATGGSSAPNTPARPQIDPWPERLSYAQVFSIAKAHKARFRFGITATMATAVAMIESGDFRNLRATMNTRAYRSEPQINDASYGLMQVLWKTAKWLHDVKGYKGYRLTQASDLYKPETGIYFGMAYLDWLKRAYGGTDDLILRRYNGGPNGHRYPATLAYVQKYNTAKPLVLVGTGQRTAIG